VLEIGTTCDPSDAPVMLKKYSRIVNQQKNYVLKTEVGRNFHPLALKEDYFAEVEEFR